MIYTLTGKNLHLLGEHINAVTAGFISDFGDMAVERLDASEISADELISRSSNLPFLSTRKLVIIRSAEQNQGLLEKIADLVDRTPDEVDLYIIGQFDKRKSSYKDLKKHTQLKEFGEANEQSLPDWVVGYAKEQGGSISAQNARLLVNRIGAKQQQLAREIEKLLISGKEIDRKSIELMTDESIEESIFSMLDEVFSGNRKAALKRYRQQRSQQVDPHYIIAMLTWQLQQLALAVFAPDSNQQTLVSAGMSPYAAKKMLRLASSVSKSDVRSYVSMLSEADSAIKNSAGEPDAIVETFILSIS